MADDVGELHLTDVGQFGRHHALGDVARHVGRRAVHLARVLAGEGAAAVTAHAAVGVDDDLAAGQAGVGLGAAVQEGAGGVDEDHRAVQLVALGVHQAVGQQAVGDDRLDDVLDEGGAQVVELQGGAVVRGNHQVGDGHRHVVLVLHRHLRLAVGVQAGHDALLAHLGQAPGEPVGKVDGRRHQFRIHVVQAGFLGGVAEHHALVAGTLLLEQALAAGHALRDVGALRLHVHLHLAGVGVKTDVRRGVADVAHRLAGDALDVQVGQDGFAHLARNHHQVFGDQGFAGHAGLGVDRQRSIQDAIRYLVADLVRVAFRYAFRGKCDTHGFNSPWGMLVDVLRGVESRHSSTAPAASHPETTGSASTTRLWLRGWHQPRRQPLPQAQTALMVVGRKTASAARPPAGRGRGGCPARGRRAGCV